MRVKRVVYGLIAACLLLVGLRGSAHGAAAAGLGPERFLGLPAYAFQPRSSTVTIEYAGAGCIYRSNTSGSALLDALVADVQLPQGARLSGVQLYLRDLSPSDATLKLYAYSGPGNASELAAVSSSGSPGYQRFDVSLSTPYVVDNGQAALGLEWSAGASGEGLRLCGVRLVYQAPLLPAAAGEPAPGVIDPALHALQQKAYFSGQAFWRQSSTAAYEIGASGCLGSGTGGIFHLDLHLPPGARLQGLKMDYLDLSAIHNLYGQVAASDGHGGITLLTGLNNGSAWEGLGSVSTSISPALLLNEASRAYAISVSLPADPLVQLCALQVVYLRPGLADLPEPPGSSLPVAERTRYHFQTGVAFARRSATAQFGSPVAGCTSLAAGSTSFILQKPLLLPPTSLLNSAVFHYYDGVPQAATIFIADYNGVGVVDEFLSVDSAGAGGYGSASASPASPFDTGSGRLMGTVLNSGAVTAGMAVCGVRLQYTINAALYSRPLQGDGQTVQPGEAFPQPLRVLVVDDSGAPAPGVVVSFTPPAVGASALLSSPTAVTGADGQAQVSASANLSSGRYRVALAINGVPLGTRFELTNGQVTLYLPVVRK